METQDLPPLAAKDIVHVVVETPRGANVKLKWDPELRAFALKRALPLGFAYPYDWGFVPGTKAEDGDPVDALVCWEGASPVGTVLRCRPLGVLQISQRSAPGERKRVRNDRILAVPEGDARTEWLGRVEDLPQRIREELAHFFVSSVAFERKDPKVVGWAGPPAALELVRRSRKE
jgi:inorganic pyrophosphatase